MQLKNKKFSLMIFAMIISGHLQAEGISTYQIPFGNKNDSSTEGTITINESNKLNRKIGKDFYGADSHGFSRMPDSTLVTPLNLGYTKLGGSLHAVYNWEINAYFHHQEVSYVYASLVDRLNLIKNNYKSTPMWQVNMLGLQPDYTKDGELKLLDTANAQHAADAVTFLNGVNNLGLKHILMGNEPFDSEDFNDIHIPSADEYIAKYIEYAVALRSAQEKISGNPNDIKLWGPEINTGWTGWQTNHLPDCIIDYNRTPISKCSYGDGKFKDFIPYFLFKLNEFEQDPIRNPNKYKLIDYVTFHYYALFRSNFNDPASIIRDDNGQQDVHAMLESTNVWDNPRYVNWYDRASLKGEPANIVGKFKNWINKYYPTAKTGVTEFGVDSMDKIKYHPIVRPLYLADSLGKTAAAGLDSFINSFLQSGDVSNSWAMIDGKKKTTLYYIYGLYTNYFLGNLLPVSDTLGDIVNGYAVKTAKGINLFLINKDMKNHNVKIQLDESSQMISEMSIPAWSLSVVEIPDNQLEDITVHRYGAKEMGIAVDLKNW